MPPNFYVDAFAPELSLEINFWKIFQKQIVKVFTEYKY